MGAPSSPRAGQCEVSDRPRAAGSGNNTSPRSPRLRAGCGRAAPARRGDVSLGLLTSGPIAGPKAAPSVVPGFPCRFPGGALRPTAAAWPACQAELARPGETGRGLKPTKRSRIRAESAAEPPVRLSAATARVSGSRAVEPAAGRILGRRGRDFGGTDQRPGTSSRRSPSFPTNRSTGPMAAGLAGNAPAFVNVGASPAQRAVAVRDASFAASSMTPATTPAWLMKTAWLAATSVTFAPMRLAM